MFLLTDSSRAFEALSCMPLETMAFFVPEFKVTNGPKLAAAITMIFWFNDPDVESYKW